MKTPIDWQELYAANREAIERAGGARGPAPAPLPALPASRSATRRPLIHVPAGLDAGRAVPIVCMLHGCGQDAAAFAAATAMNDAADRHGFVVVYPQQDREANPGGCWNWFLPEHQSRGRGEPEAITASLRDLVEDDERFTVDTGRVFAAGLSAGGAMAAILAATYPDLFAAIAVHSGLAYRSASSMAAAFTAMAHGSEADEPPGRAVPARPVPTIVVHGSDDRTVAPVNADRVLRRSMAANRLAAVEARDLDIARPTSTAHGRARGGLAYTHSRWADAHGALMHELLMVDGLGHAWSGGRAGASHADPRGPDATEAIVRFFAEASAG
jgi:poly(hydroxyalkanoate) depolymerase family esterase